MTDNGSKRAMVSYTEIQAITKIENILARVQPVSARGRVMGYVAKRLADEAVQEQLMADPRQEKLPLAEVAE